MDAPAVPLLGLISSFDRASVPDAPPLTPRVIPALSLHQSLNGLAVSTGQCYSPRPEEQGLARKVEFPVQTALLGYVKSYK
jgi:hypothetical protein